MNSRKLGKSDIHIAPLVLGGNVFGWTLDEAASFRVLDEFVAGGLNCIDTADVYARWVPGNKGGESETIIGKWMRQRGNRGRIVIATKVGMEMGPGKKGLSKAYIREAVEASLRRLQTDYIDLYQSHEDDPGTALEETLQTYKELIDEGKIRVIGASNYKGARLNEALDLAERRGLPRYESLQPHYNLMDRSEFETDLEAICTQRQLGVITYFSLASGFLTGKYRQKKDLVGARASRVERYLTPRGEKVLSALDSVANAHNTKPAAVALAWLIARPSITAPIASATSPSQVQTLVEATQLELDGESIEKLNRSST